MATLNDIMRKHGYKQGVRSMLTDNEYLTSVNRQLEEQRLAEERAKNNGGFFGGLGYFFHKLGLGFVSGIEGIWDYAAGGLADLFGADEWAEEQFANDWVNYNAADEWFNPDDTWKVVGDVGGGIGTSLPALIAAAGTAAVIYFSGGTASGGAAAFWASYGPAIVGSTVAGFGGAGNATKEAYKETGQLTGKEYGYGALVGTAEAGLEFATAGIGAGSGRLIKEMTEAAGKGAAKGVGKTVVKETAEAVVKETAEAVAKEAVKKTAKTITAKTITTGLLKDFGGEAFEEGVQEMLDPYFKRWTQVDPDAKNATAQQIAYAALVGGLSGVLMGGAGNIISASSSSISYISRGNKIAKNEKTVNSILDFSRKAALYETEHNTGEIIYQQTKQLVEKFDSLNDGSGKYTVAQKKILGQLSELNVGLTLSEPVKRSREKIKANAERFIAIINDRNIMDGTTGKPFHFNSVEELLNNEDLLTQFAVGDALGQLMLRKDAAYDYIMGRKNTGLTLEEFRQFQKEGKAEHKKGISEVFGVDIDSVTYEDFIEKMKTTSRSTIENKQAAMKVRNTAKKAISKAINAKETVPDVKTYDKNSNIENGTTVYKVDDSEYCTVTKTDTGYYLFIGGNVSVEMTKKQLDKTMRELKKSLKGVNPQPPQTTVKKTTGAEPAPVNANVDENVRPHNPPNVPPVNVARTATATESVVVPQESSKGAENITDTTVIEEIKKPERVDNPQVKETVKKGTKKTEVKKADKAAAKTKKVEKIVNNDDKKDSTTKSDTATTETVKETSNKTKKASKTKGKERLVKLTHEIKRPAIHGAVVKDGKQYICDGYFGAVYNDIDETLTKVPIEEYPIDGLIKTINNAKSSVNENNLVNVDVNALRALVPAKKAESINFIAKLGDSYFQIRHLSRVLDTYDNPKLYVPAKPTDPMYIEADNGYAVLMPIRAAAGGKIKPAYTAEYVNKQAVKTESEKSSEKTATTARKIPVIKTQSETKATTKKEAKPTTKKKAPEKTNDFGEKIGGARKDTWQKRGLVESDLSAMNRRELEKHVKKDNVWKRPDYVKAIAEGGNRVELYIQNEFYKSVNAVPYIRYSVATDSTSPAFQQALEKYIKEVREVKSLVETIKTKEDLTKITEYLFDKGYLESTGNSYRPYKWTAAYYDSPALYGSKIFETAQKLAKGFESIEETSIMEGFAVDKANKLPNGYTIKRISSYWDSRGTKYVIVKGGKNGTYASPYFSSYEEAFAFGKATFGTAESTTVDTTGKKKRFIPEQLKDVHRTGLDYRADKNATGEDFLRDFGIKGGEFGNWLSENDRTTSLNYGYDAFCDLADALNIDLTDISLNGTLSIGFGSRGQGLSGASAHYESERKVINLTKMNGAGSLAHEWWHAVEDYISGNTNQSSMASDFSKTPEKTKAAAKALLNAINYKDTVIGVEELNENRAKQLERTRRWLERSFETNFKIFSESLSEEAKSNLAKTYRYKRMPTAEEIEKFKTLKEQAFKGVEGTLIKFHAGTRTIVDDLSDLIKDIKGRVIEKDERRNLAGLIENMSTFSAEVVETQKRRVKTQFYKDAIAIGKTYQRDGGYWDSNCEMLARAFASYIDMKTNGGNGYLSGHALSAAPVINEKGEMDIAFIYPHEKTEADAIYKAFDDFFAAAKTDGLLHETKRVKPTSTVRYAISENTQLNTQPAGNQSQELKPLQMKRAESVARMQIKGFANLTEGQKLEVEWTLASAWRYGVSETEALQLAKIATELGTGIGFANISTTDVKGAAVNVDGVCYTRGGHSTIYLSPNTSKAVEVIALEEITHALEGTEGYSELQKMAEEYYNKHPEERKEIEKAYKKLYKDEQVSFADDILPLELTAHYVRETLSKRSMIEKLTKEQPETTRGILGFIKKLKTKFTKAEPQTLSNIELLENRFKSVYNQLKNDVATGKPKTASTRYSVVKVNGKDMVLIDTEQHIFENVTEPKELRRIAREYIKTHFRNDVYKTTDGKGVVFTRKGAKKITNTEYLSKIRISTELDNFIKVAQYVKTELNNKDTNPEFAYFDYYTADFILDGKMFDCTINIGINTKTGVGVFYEITNIKEKAPHNSFENNVLAPASNGTSTVIISKNGENVNTSGKKRFSVSEAEDRVMTELPNERVTLRDVITKRKTAGQLGAQVKGDTSQYTEGFRIAMVNAQAGLERVLKESGVKDGNALTNYVRAAKYAANNALEIEGGQYDLLGETRLGDSWGKIWQPIYKLDAKDGKAYAKFQEYLLHWHNIDRYAVGKPVFGDNVTMADSQAAIAEIEKNYPQFAKIAQKVWTYCDNLLQLSVDSGMYSKEYADSIRATYPHYVPTYREEHQNGVNALSGKNNVSVNINKKKATGSDARILPIDDMVAAQTIQKYPAARINKLLVELLNGKKHDEFSVISSEDGNIDIDTEALVTTYQDKAKNTHQVTFYHDGKKITAEVSRNVYKGIEAFIPNGDTAFNNAILNGAAKINTLFKKLVTSWNPFFSFFRNPMRDIQDAGLYTRYPLKTFTKNYGRARTEISTNGKYWQEAKAAGITAASVYDYEKGLTYKKEKNVAKRVFAKLEKASNAIEMAPRLAEYISAREAGLSVQEALLQAQDVTTNFGRGGEFSKKLNSTIMPFLNPAIQGFSKMLRAYTGKDAALSWVNLILRSVMLGIGITALNDLLNDDDEEYNDLSDYVKENNYVIGIGNGNYIKIPKGRVVSVFGGAYLRSKWYFQGDKEAFEGYLKNIASQVTPVDNFSRTIFSPITDISTNTTWYGGTIEGQKWDDTQPKDRYDETTSSIAIWLGRVFNYSPTKIDYLLEQYGGIVADIVLPATTLQAEKGVISQNLLVNSTTNSRWSTEFYDQKEKYTHKKTAGDSAAKGVVKYLNSVNGTISDMYKQKRDIQGDSSLSNDEKLKQTQIIQASINALQKDSLTNAKYLYEELKKYGDLSNEEYFETSYLDAVSAVVGDEFALKSYNSQVYAKAQKLNKIGISYGTFYDFYFDMKNISADMNISGGTVAGSKKANVIDYVMSLNLSNVEKLILIMTSGYTIKDGDIYGLTAKQAKTMVAKHLQSAPITSQEKLELAKMCGLTVEGKKIIIK